MDFIYWTMITWYYLSVNEEKGFKKFFLRKSLDKFIKEKSCDRRFRYEITCGIYFYTIHYWYHYDECDKFTSVFGIKYIRKDS